MNKLFTKIASLTLGLAMAIGVGVAVGKNSNVSSSVKAGDEDPFYTLSTNTATGENASPDNNYTAAVDTTINGIEWSVMANSYATPWRIGGKNTQNTDRPIYSKTGMGSAIERIVYKHGAATAGKNSAVVFNSVTLIVSANQDFSNPSDTIVVSDHSFSSAGEIEFTPTSPLTNWEKDSYYKFVTNYKLTSGSNNSYYQLQGVDFYAYESGETGTPLTQPVLSREGGVISWTEDTNADHYEIKVNDGEWTTTHTKTQHTIALVDSMFYTIKVKAIAAEADTEHSDSDSGTLSFDTLLHAGTENDPYCVADARAVIDKNEGLADKYVTGIVSEIVTKYSTQYSNVTFNFSSDGTTTSNQMQAYRAVGSSASTVAVGDVVVVSGTLKKYNSTYEFDSGCTIVSCKKADSHTVTISTDSITLSANEIGTSGSIILTTAAKKKGVITSVTNANYSLEGNVLTLTDVTDDVVITASVVDAEITSLTLTGYPSKLAVGGDFSSEGLVVTGTYDDWVDGEHTSEVITTGYTVDSSAVDMNVKGEYTVTVTYAGLQSTYKVKVAEILDITKGEYHLVTDLNQLYDGANITIANPDGDVAMKKAFDTSKNNIQGISVNHDEASSTISTASKELVLNLTLEKTAENTYRLKLDDDVYLYASSSTQNNMARGTAEQAGDNGKFLIELNGSEFTITAQGSNSRKLMRFNSNNGSPLFSCYATNSTTGTKPVIYVFETYVDEATEYAGKFLKANGSSFADCAATRNAWTNLKTEYGKLTGGAQEIFEKADHVDASVYKDSTEISVAHAVARYDDAVIKNTTLQTPENEFMGRFGEGKVNSSAFTNELDVDSSMTATIVVIVSMATITLLGACLILRKRREQR